MADRNPLLTAGGAVARSIETAPRDGTMVRLLVSFTEHATEDSPDPSWTIGANNFDHDGEDRWLFAGWCWTHDHFTQGQGTPVGWLPMLDTAPPAAQMQQGRADLVPGVMRCAKCAFQLVRTNLYVATGTVGAGDSKTEPCPNGCGPLWPVTWKMWAEEGWAQAERYFEALCAPHPAAGDKVREGMGQRISAYLCGLAENGVVTLDPFDSNNIDAIVEAALAKPQEAGSARPGLQAVECGGCAPPVIATGVPVAESRTFSVRMAKATQQDIDAAFELSSILDALDRGYYPSRETDEDPPTYFDSDDRDHLQYLHERLTDIASRGSLFRVVGGLSTLLAPENAIVDPDDDCIALHPRFSAHAASNPEAGHG